MFIRVAIGMSIRVTVGMAVLMKFVCGHIVDGRRGKGDGLEFPILNGIRPRKRRVRWLFFVSAVGRWKQAE